jgi:hypothetical protein
MPRPGSITGDIVKVLRKRPDGASLAEIRSEVTKLRGEVLPHSLRSAIYGHLGDRGEKLFVRLNSSKRDGRYKLRG